MFCSVRHVCWYIRDLKQRRRRRQGRRLEKNEVIFYRRISQMFSTSIGLRTCSSLICNASVQFQMKIRKISRRRSRSPKYPEFGPFTLSFCRGRLRNVPLNNYNASAQPLFCSLNRLFCGVLVAVAVVVCLSSLMLSPSVRFVQFALQNIN